MTDGSPAGPLPAISEADRSVLAAWLEARGEPAYRAGQVLAGAHRSEAEGFADLTDLPSGLRDALASAFRFSTIDASHVIGADGGLTAKAVHELHDGQRIESVLMRYPARGRSAARTTVCISSQAGCAVNCPFCATGQAGFAQMAVDNTGGWQLTVDTFARGGRVSSEDGMTATLTNDATKAALQFLNGLEDDQPLFRSRDDAKRAKFRKGMTASEIAELVTDSLAAVGAEKVVATGLRPEPFAGTEGFRFDLRFQTKSGLEKQGFVVGAVVKERLYLIMYSGLVDHYFAKHREDAERVIRSVRVK